MKDYPASQAAFSHQGIPYESGEILRQPDLAATLRRIQEHGRDGFYRGITASFIVDAMNKNGGLITESDLTQYQAKERPPVRGTYRSFEIIGMPPPSSGGTAIIEMLNILEAFDLHDFEHNETSYVHLVTEAMRCAFRDRAKYLGDPDFEPMPVKKLCSKEYAARLQETLPLSYAGQSSPSDLTEPAESDETTHFSVVDSDGMAVAVTYTLEYSYGSGIVVPGAGFILNNEMGDFNAKKGLTTQAGLIGTSPNLAAPRKRMLSSMSPTILTRDKELYAVLGSPGGRTIINTVLLVALNLMDFEMSMKEAVEAPRFHHQWLPEAIYLEKKAASPSLTAGLKKMGHPVEAMGIMGHAHCILFDSKSGTLYGAADPRDRDSKASGL